MIHNDYTSLKMRLPCLGYGSFDRSGNQFEINNLQWKANGPVCAALILHLKLRNVERYVWRVCDFHT